MSGNIGTNLAGLNQVERSSFFRKCMITALWIQIGLFVATFLTSIAIRFVVTFIGLFVGKEASELDTMIRVLQWFSLVPWTLASFWWYTQWLFREQFGPLRVAFCAPLGAGESNNALHPTSEDARG